MSDGFPVQCRERLEREISEAAPPNSKIKVVSPANAIERRFSVWIGAYTQWIIIVTGKERRFFDVYMY